MPVAQVALHSILHASDRSSATSGILAIYCASLTVTFARRSGRDWYVALLNCKEMPKTYSIQLAFLGERDYASAIYHDALGPSTSLRIEAGHSVQKAQTISIELKGAGGFVGRFSRPNEYTK